jgi:hypothetical protein
MPPFLLWGLAAGVSVEPIHRPARASSWLRSIRGNLLTDRIQLAGHTTTIGLADCHGFLTRLVDRPAHASAAITLGSSGKRLGVATISEVVGEILLTTRQRTRWGR